jgi:hypothetical protein
MNVKFQNFICLYNTEKYSPVSTKMQMLNFLEFYIPWVNIKRYCKCRILPFYIPPTFSCWHHCPSYCGLLFKRYRVRIFVIWCTIPRSFYIALLYNYTEYITHKVTLLNFTSAEGANPCGNKKIHELAVACVAPALDNNESLASAWQLRLPE